MTPSTSSRCFIDALFRVDEGDSAPRMAQALARAINRTFELVNGTGQGSASYLNIAISDGEHAVALLGCGRRRARVPGQLYPDVGPAA